MAPRGHGLKSGPLASETVVMIAVALREAADAFSVDDRTSLLK